MKTKTCPRCQQENPENALACAKCGTLFTVQIPMGITNITFPSPVNIQTEEEEHTLFLYIMGDKQPTVLKNQREITLGRFTPDTVPPTVELSSYGDNKLGISRKHAVIEYNGKDYLLRDLGSSNGTWLNEVQLIAHRNYVLHSGDRVRLAQLPLIVYFKEKRFNETGFYLTYSDFKPHFSPSDMAREIMPFLQALEGIQEIVDAITPNSNGTGLSLRTIRVEPSANRVAVYTQGGVDAVHYVQAQVNAWKKDHQFPEEDLGELVQVLTNQLNSDLSPEEMQPYLEQLSTLLPVILFSPLELSPIQ